MSTANILIGVGLVFTVVGLGGLVYCIDLARRIRSMDPKAQEIRTAFYRISAVNMASMGGAFVGLALVLVGLIIS